MYNFNGETFRIEKSNNGFKLYHKAKNKWSSGWTFIGLFNSEEKAIISAKLYTN